MEVPNSESLIRQIPTTEVLIKPVPKPFSIEALISDTGPYKNSTLPSWCGGQNFIHNQHHHHQQQINRDTDSDGSIELDLAQDLSRNSHRDGKFRIISI